MGTVQKLTEFQGRSGLLAWTLLLALYAWFFVWFSIQQPFEIDVSKLNAVGILICLMAAILLALAAAKQRRVGGQSWQGALSGAQLFMAGWLFLLLFTLCGSVLTYIGQAVAAPLQDHTFAFADAALGLDFVGFHAWVGTVPLLPEAMYVAYNSCRIQFLIIFLACAVTLDRENAAQLCSLLVLTIVPTIVLATLWPALGSCVYHEPVAEPFTHLDPLACREYLPHVESLRNGTFQVFDFTQTKGIVTFPSFHTVMAIIATYAVRHYRWLFVPFVLLNTVNILSTVPLGGHYFVDVLGGAAIALSAIAIVRWNAARLPVVNVKAAASAAVA
jgi:membrane-associated phospholipid phosphatase